MSSLEDLQQLGEWTRIAQLGSGTFGTVSLWKHQITSEQIAIKRCKLHLPSEKQKERWIKEVKFMQQIRNANIVSFRMLPSNFETQLNKYNPSKLPLLSMEYCQNGNLRNALNNTQNSCGLAETEVINLLNDMSNALSFLHQLNITHRDFKPENIVLQTCNDRSSEVVYKLIDLGYAKTLDTILSVVGTPLYIAPEIIFGEKYSVSVDYWSFAIVAYEVMTGFHPFLWSLPFAERIKYLKNKTFDEICLFKLKSEVVKASNRIAHNTLCNPILRKHMESWLRFGLDYNAKRRGRSEENGINFFERLRIVLKTKALKVFAVPTYHIHYFEFDEHSTIGSLKNWIEDEIGILKIELLVFNEKGCVDEEDDCLISNVVNHVNPKLFVVNQSDFIDDVQRVQAMFLNDILSSSSRKLDREQYSTVMNFMNSEKDKLYFFCDACEILHKYSKNLFQAAKVNFLKITRQWSVMMSMIQMFHHFSNKKNLGKLGNEYKKILLVLDTFKERTKLLEKRCKSVEKQQLNLESLFLECSFGKNKETMNTLYKQFLKVTDKKVVKLCMEAIKIRDLILKKSEPIKKFGQKSVLIISELRKLLTWMNELLQFSNEMNLMLRLLNQKFVNNAKELYQENEKETNNCDASTLIDANENLRNLFNSVFLRFLCDVKEMYMSLEI